MSYSSSIHDKKLFINEYKENKELIKIKNNKLSSKRIKIKHVFAYIKSYKIIQRLNYDSKN